MGTIDPPPTPRPAEDRDAEPARSIWTHPLFLMVAVVLFGWAAYWAGHRAATPVLPPKPTTAPVPQVVYVPFPIHASPASATPSAPPLTVTASAAPAAPPAYMQERRGAASMVDAKPGPSPDGFASLQAMQAEEKQWRDRAAAARARLAKAQDDYNKISDANPLIQLRDGGISAAALGSRNAALSPYQLELDAARAEVDRLPEDCRVAGCQPGWIR